MQVKNLSGTHGSSSSGPGCMASHGYLGSGTSMVCQIVASSGLRSMQEGLP
ncbi:MAG: hypothetical protein ACK56F_01265 [bacterium]